MRENYGQNVLKCIRRREENTMNGSNDKQWRCDIKSNLKRMSTHTHSHIIAPGTQIHAHIEWLIIVVNLIYTLCARSLMKSNGANAAAAAANASLLFFARTMEWIKRVSYCQSNQHYSNRHTENIRMHVSTRNIQFFSVWIRQRYLNLAKNDDDDDDDGDSRTKIKWMKSILTSWQINRIYLRCHCNNPTLPAIFHRKWKCVPFDTSCQRTVAC